MNHHKYYKNFSRYKKLFKSIQLLIIFLLHTFYISAFAEDNQNANVNSVIEFSIAAGPLDKALREFAQQAGVFISFSAEQVSNLSTSGLVGAFSFRQGVSQLMSGTGHSIVNTTTGYTVKKVALNKSTERMQPITVTGELQERTLQESQSSVSVITEEVIDNSNIVNLEEIFLRTPNVSQIFNGSGFAIRGIPDRGLGSGLGDTSPTTAIYIDGAVQSINGGINGVLSTWDLQQVEIYRGPQTTSLGRSALAGSIVVRSNDPDYFWDLKGRASVAEDNTEQYALAFGGPIIDDMLAFRFTADVTDTDGYTRFRSADVSIDDIGVDDRELYRGKLLFEPVDNLSALLTVTHSDAKRGSDVVNGEDPFEAIRTTAAEISDTEVTSGVLELTYDLSEQFKITSTTSYTELEREQELIEETAFAPGAIAPGIAEDDSFTQELKLQYDNDDRLRGTLGFYYADIEEQSERQISATVGPFAIERNDGFDNSFENYAAFGELEYDLNDTWTLVAGGRYDREDSDREEFAVTDVTPDTPAFPDGSEQFEGSSSFDAWLPKLGLIYNFNKDLSLSFTIQEAYRPGGVDIRPDDPATVGINESAPVEFDPEYTWNYDLALRSVWLDGDLFLNANLFYVDYEDMQLRVADNPATPIVRFIDNAGEAELYGLEVEMGYNVSNNLSLYGSLALMDTELDEFEFQGSDLSGQEIPYASNLSFSFGGTYRHQSGVNVTVDNSYTGSFYSSLTDEDNSQVSSFFITNIRAGYENQDWAIYGFVSNLFDKDYVTDRIRDPDPDMSFATLGQPRTAGIALEVKL